MSANRFAAALIYFLATLWVFAYVIGQLPWTHWAHFPTFMTWLVVGIGGVVWIFARPKAGEQA